MSHKVDNVRALAPIASIFERHHPGFHPAWAKNEWNPRASLADRGDKVLHVFLIDAADRSDPEAVGLVQLAGIDDKAARYGDDDRTLQI